MIDRPRALRIRKRLRKCALELVTIRRELGSVRTVNVEPVVLWVNQGIGDVSAAVDEIGLMFPREVIPVG